MSQQDYYELLGVNRDANADEIKRAFRKKAMEFHPDRNRDNPEAEQKFKEVNEAYDVLSDDQKKAAYDQYGHAAFQQGGAGGGAGGFSGFSGFSDIFEEMFGDMMGGGNRRQAQRRGADLRFDLEISLEDAFHGTKKQIKIPKKIVCDSCSGTGSQDNEGPIACTTCNGHGKVRMQQGFFTIERTCPTCEGTGQMIKNPCGKCHGQGVVQAKKTLNVDIPAGIDDGMRIRLTGEGDSGPRGSNPGDLYVFIHVKEHDLFIRNENDLYCQIPIPMTMASLGGDTTIPNIDGSKVKVNVAEGTQSGHRVRLKNMGMTKMRSNNRGHCYVEFLVETPVKLSKKQKELLKEFDKEYKANEHKHRPSNSSGFFSKMRSFWNEG